MTPAQLAKLNRIEELLIKVNNGLARVEEEQVKLAAKLKEQSGRLHAIETRGEHG